MRKTERRFSGNNTMKKIVLTIAFLSLIMLPLSGCAGREEVPERSDVR